MTGIMTDQERFEAFLQHSGWKLKAFPANDVTHDTMICFSYCDLYFRDGVLLAAVRCLGREDEHEPASPS